MYIQIQKNYSKILFCNGENAYVKTQNMGH